MFFFLKRFKQVSLHKESSIYEGAKKIAEQIVGFLKQELNYFLIFIARSQKDFALRKYFNSCV